MSLDFKNARSRLSGLLVYLIAMELLLSVLSNSGFCGTSMNFMELIGLLVCLMAMEPLLLDLSGNGYWGSSKNNKDPKFNASWSSLFASMNDTFLA